MSATYDKDALSTLTQAEQDAIAEHEEEIKANPPDTGRGDDDDSDDDDLDNDPTDTEAAAQPAEKAAVEVVPDPAETSEADPEETAQPDPIYVAELPADHAEKLSAIDAGMAELDDKFESGDIDFAEHKRETAKLYGEREILRNQAIKAEVSAEMREQAEQNAWRNTIAQQFSVAKKSDGIDYTNDTVKRNQLDLFVKALANDPVNEDKPAKWFLQEAHKSVLAMHGLIKAAAKADEKPNNSRKPPLSSIPVNLSQIPGGGDASDLAGEFVDIDKLEGLELEKAIGRMTPEQRNRYMSGS